MRSNKEHFLYSSAWHHLSTLADAERMLRTKHPSGDEARAFGFLSARDDLSLEKVCASGEQDFVSSLICVRSLHSGAETLQLGTILSQTCTVGKKKKKTAGGRVGQTRSFYFPRTCSGC